MTRDNAWSESQKLRVYLADQKMKGREMVHTHRNMEVRITREFRENIRDLMWQEHQSQGTERQRWN